MVFVVVDVLWFGVSCLLVFEFCRLLFAVSCFCFVSCFLFCGWCCLVQLVVSSFGFGVGCVFCVDCLCLLFVCLLLLVGCLVNCVWFVVVCCLLFVVWCVMCVVLCLLCVYYDLSSVVL